MANAADPWSEITEILDELTGNAAQIREFLASRRPEDGDSVTYAALERMLKTRDACVERAKKVRAAMEAGRGSEPNGWREEFETKVAAFLEVEAENQKNFDRLSGFYKDKLKQNKQAADTISAYQQQLQTALDMNVGSTFNQAQ